MDNNTIVRQAAVHARWVERLEAHVIESMNDGCLSVEELAAKLKLSSRQLRRKLKQATGLAPVQFIRDLQLNAACKELDEGPPGSLADVAFRYGFKHQATFSTLFKDRFGVSPSEYLRTQ